MNALNIFRNTSGVGLSLLFIGAGVWLTHTVFLNSAQLPESGSVQFESLSNFQEHNLFIQILLSNTLVMLLILYGGFFTGGILTALILTYNAVLMTVLFQEALLSMPWQRALLKTAFHGLLELYVFLVAANMSYRGFSFYRRAMQTETFDTSRIPGWKTPLTLTIMLGVAAVLEVINIRCL